MEKEDFLWAGYAFFGGVAGNQSGPCGAVGGSAVYIGLRNRHPLSDKPRAAEARLRVEREADKFVKAFIERFGSIGCFDLVKTNLGDPVVRRQWEQRNGGAETCDRFVSFAIEKLYEMEEQRDS